MPPPLVIILDIDGTVIGDISPQIITYDICKEVKANGGALCYKFKDMSEKLKSGILRPYFIEFVKKLKKRAEHVEFFIYTASEKKWAHNIIGHIEKAAKLKFNKPYFTREHCIPVAGGDYMKSLAKVKPAIFKTLKRKYPGELKTIKDLEGSICMIDNREVYVKEDSKYHILCSTYDYKIPENIPAIVGGEEWRKHWQVIGKVIERYMDIRPTGDYLLFQQRFYAKYVGMLGEAAANNEKFKGDLFFRRLYKVIVNVMLKKDRLRFDGGIVKYMNGAVNAAP